MNTSEMIEISIGKLLKSNISAYRIHQDFNELPLNVITRLRNGEYQIENLRFYSIKKLHRIYLYYAERGLIQ